MSVIKELNRLAEKVTGVNPKAKTDKQALDFIITTLSQQKANTATYEQALKKFIDIVFNN